MTTKYRQCHGNCAVDVGSRFLACFLAFNSGRYHCNESSSKTSKPLTAAAGTMVTKLVSVCAPKISLARCFLLLLLLLEYRHIRLGLMLTSPSSCSISALLMLLSGLPSSIISSVSRMAASEARISARFKSSSDGSSSSSMNPETEASSKDNPAMDAPADPSSSITTDDPAVKNASASTLDAAVAIRTTSLPMSDITSNASTILCAPSPPTNPEISLGRSVPSDLRRRVSKN
mmetsp:Transcript_8629/g.15009  ORF Transcript_8629/g.15009 Transcript_8629/m.15009 type:complete len:232 (-) Transcript_8629:147-842(-)